MAHGLAIQRGASGFSGISGISGISGLSGQSGYSGVSGFSGTSGFSGSSGTSGFSGFSGLSFNPKNRITVGLPGSTGVDYNTIGEAITAANALSPSLTNQILIEVYPGAYTEDPLTIPSNVQIQAANSVGFVKILPTDDATAMVTLSDNSLANGLQVSDVDGSGGIAFLYVGAASKEAGVFNCFVQNCETAFCVQGDPTANFGVVTSRAILCGTAYKISTGGGTLTSAGSAAVLSTTYDLQVDNSSGTVLGTFTILDDSKITLDSGGTYAFTHIDSFPSNEGLAVIGNMSVGRPETGKESSFGEGGVHVVGMVVQTNTNGTAGTWTDRTSEAASPSGSSFAAFPGTSAENALYVGGDNPFFNLSVDTATAIALGAGAIAWEYWNGSAWTSFLVMASTDSGIQYAQDTFGRVAIEEIRFGEMTGWATTSLNSVTKYWVRARVTTGITTSPVIEQIKIGVNRTKINDEGSLSYFGSAEPKGVLLTRFGLTRALLAITPKDDDLEISSTVTMITTGNSFENNAEDAIGDFIIVPDGMDTSMPIEYDVFWHPNTTATGDVEIELIRSSVSLGDVLDGTLAETRTGTVTTISTASNKALFKTTISFTAPDLVPGEFVSIAIVRDATGTNADDTYTGSISIVQIRATATFWK